MKTFLICASILFGVLFLIVFGVRVYKDVIFDRECEGHLKRAADANSVELATQELETALNYLKANKVTEGYTSVMYTTPDEDVGFWYKNLTTSLDELKSLPANTTPLERTNVLMKLRETLLDKGERSESVTGPSGIGVFPLNALYAFLTLTPLSLAALSLIGLVFVYIREDC